jgi:serine/threonine-protein kinase RsbT
MAEFSAGSVARDLRRSPSTPDPTVVETGVPILDVEGALSRHVTEVRIHIDSDRAIVDARQHGRQLGMRVGFGIIDRAVVTTIISELGRNILLYAARGDIVVKMIDDDGRVGLSIEASDQGPGIANIDDALRDGFSTAGRLGLGLPGVRRLSDEMSLVSIPGQRTTVLVKKWRR